MDHEQDSADTPAVSRVQNQLHLLPEDWSAVGAVIEPLFERLDSSLTGGTQLLVVTNDPEAAAGVAAGIAASSPGDRRVLGATDARRALRVLRSTPAQVVVGSPGVLIELIQATALKLDAVRCVVLAWVDDLDGAATRALEALMTDLSKDSMRVVIAGGLTPAVEQLVERYARRARRVQPSVSEPTPPVSLMYVATTETGRLIALRRLLDAVDPASAIIVVRSADSQESVEALLRSLGYLGDSVVRVASMPEPNAQLVVLYDLPLSEDDMRNVVRAAGGARVVALAAPRQLAALRRLAGAAVTPFALPAAAERARSREERLREELREVLTNGHYSHELLSLEPLLADYDGVEVAAAALRLLQTERSKPRQAAESAPPMTRLYVNVGEMDNVRAGDLVGAITNEGGISRSELGRVEVRDRHSTVEVASGVADSVVAKLTGVSIKGRRALVKVDEERERRDRPSRERPTRERPGGGRDRPGHDRPGRDRPRRNNR